MILTRAALLTALADNDSGAITEKILRDIVDSLIGIGGTMYAAEETIAITTSWAPFAFFTNSIDTKGLSEDLDAGHFTLGAGADGVYAVDTSLNVFSPFAGWVEIAITKNGALTPYRDVQDITTDGRAKLSIPASGNLAAGDTIGLAIRGSGNANITMTSGQFRTIRI